MNQLTLKKLEYDKIIEMLVKECSSHLGENKAKQLKPITNYEEIVQWQTETTEGVTLRRYEPHIPLGGIIDISRQLRKIEIGGMLEPEEFLQLLDVLVAARRLNNFLVHRKKAYAIPRLEWWGGQLAVFPELEALIDDTIAPEATVRDTASDELYSVRRKISTLRNRIKEKMDGLVRSQSKYLQDAIVTIREDRYVVPVKQEYRTQIPGIVHDQSASGATLYIEPMAVVEMNNDLRNAYSKERDEVIKVLTALSQKIAPSVEALQYNLEVLAQIDFIFAKARLSENWQAIAPKLVKTPEVAIKQGRHPLIDAKKVVPLTLALGEQYDSIIITGPNTGGKTVTLKTVGLFVLMTQSGLHVPAEVGTTMGIFQKVYADIGDEQSIEQSLSTFSSHMTNIVQILQKTDKQSLVLLDELGAGTDPSEGAALAISILDNLLKQGAKIIATTHYSELKAYAFEEERVQNASVEFDVETLSPTYRLLVGVPGKSNAFEIAQKLGIKPDIIQNARTLIAAEQNDVSELIQSLETNNLAAERQRVEAERKLREVEEQLADLEAQQTALIETTEKIKRRAEEQALDIVRQARRESEDILKEMRELQRVEANKAHNDAIALKKKLTSKEEDLTQEVIQSPTIIHNKVSKVKIGDEVYVPKFSQQATVIGNPNRQGEVPVQIGIMKLSVHLDELQAIAPNSKAKKSTGSVGKLVTDKSVSIKNEIDVRGLTVDEALEYVDKYLDDAYLSSLGQISIIHGKGTGALRSAIKTMLKNHPHVASSRLGGFSEGGNGVTIVELK